MMPLQDSLTPQSQPEDWSGAKPTAGDSRHWLARLACSSEPKLDSLNRALVAGLML